MMLAQQQGSTSPPGGNQVDGLPPAPSKKKQEPSKIKK